MNPPAISIFEYSTIEIHCILCHKSKRWKEVLLHYENFSSSVISKNLKCCMTFHKPTKHTKTLQINNLRCKTESW